MTTTETDTPVREPADTPTPAAIEAPADPKREALWTRLILPIALPVLAALGVLLVDQPERPAEVGFGVALPAGVWWDSTQVWRQRWQRGAYGETFRFAPDGRLLRATPAGFVPDSLGSRM